MRKSDRVQSLPSGKGLTLATGAQNRYFALAKLEYFNFQEKVIL